MSRRHAEHKAPKEPKLRFLVDHDAASTAGAVQAIGWRAFGSSATASDAENVDEATQKGLSLLSMDTDLAKFPLSVLPFTVILSGNAQQSMTTATAQLQTLHRLIRIGEISPTSRQRVTLTTADVKVEIMRGDVIAFRRLGAKSRRKMRQQ